MSVGRQAVRGVFWEILSYGGGKTLSFISTIILARLLAPEDFGQVAIALLAITYLDAIGDLGIAAALIYQRDDIEKASNIAFIISIGMGVVLWALATAGAPLAAAFFREPDIVPMLRVLSVMLIIQSFGNVHRALLKKELQFKQKLIPDLMKGLFKGVAAIILALLGWEAWSLVWGQLIGATAMTVALWFVLPWRPRLTWDSALGRRMLNYGLQIVMIEILAVFWSTADYTIIGRWLGDTELGLYQQAFRVSDLLIINMCFVAGRVLFPSYAKLNENSEKLKAAFLTTIRYIALLTVPMSIGLAVIAPLFVGVVFGEKWLAMIPALQWLAIRAGISTLSFNSGHLWKAIGEPDIVNKQMVVKLVVLLGVLFYSIQYGFIAVAIGQVAVSIFTVLFELGLIVYLFDVPARAIWREIRGPLLGGAIMGVTVWFFVENSEPVWDVLQMTLAVILGVVVYTATLWMTQRELLEETVESFLSVVRPDTTAKEPAA